MKFQKVRKYNNVFLLSLVLLILTFSFYFINKVNSQDKATIATNLAALTNSLKGLSFVESSKFFKTDIYLKFKPINDSYKNKSLGKNNLFK